MPDSALTDEPASLALTLDEAAEAERLIERLLVSFPAAEGPEFLHAIALRSHDLPERLRAFLLGMRFRESAAACIISGFPVDDESIGPTPHIWGRQPDRYTTRAETTWLGLCGSILGDLFGWATQQDGAIVHDIAPIRADEHGQVGSSSTEQLWWHTEEAFHPFKCDYLGLMCLRNHDRIATTFASVAGAELTAEVRSVLFQKRFVIRPDDSHLTTGCLPGVPPGKPGRLMAAAQARIEQMNHDPQPVALLYGDYDSPYLSVDPFYMDVLAGDEPAVKALKALCSAMERRLREVILSPGEILFIDNFRAVHGRRPFHARYDGSDRWLKRINITRDLRKSRAYRLTSESRVIY